MNKHEIKLVQHLIDENKTWKSIADEYSHEVDALNSEVRTSGGIVYDLKRGIMENTFFAECAKDSGSPLICFPEWVCKLLPMETLNDYIEERKSERDVSKSDMCRNGRCI